MNLSVVRSTIKLKQHKSILLMLLIILCLTVNISAQAQGQKLRGNVKDDTGEEIVGAAVVINGTHDGIQTDFDGNFELELSNLPVLIDVSYIGHVPQSFKIDAKNINKPLKVFLKSETTELEQIMVVAYGSTSKRSFTGSAASLSSKELTELPVADVSQALQGRVAGLSVGNTSGQPGSGMSMRIRGTGSISSSKEPLYVIDGVPVVSGDLSGSSTMSSNVMSSINPDDIENITVLKDAAAASLYGSRAANGVILITTKTGQNNKTQFKLKTEYGFSDFAMPLVRQVDGDTEREIKREGLINYYTDNGYSYEEAASHVDGNGNSGISGPTLDGIAPIPNGGYSDWESELFRVGVNQNIDFSASGGNEKTRFFTSISYLKQEGVVERSDFDRLSGRVNINHKVSDKLSFGVNTTLSASEQNGILDGTSYFTNPVYGMNIFLSPTLPIYNTDGTYNENLPNGYPNIAYEQSLNNINRTLTKRSLSSLNASYDLLPNLNFKSTLGIDLIFTDFTQFNPSESRDGRATNGKTQMNSKYWQTITSSNILTYNKTINDRHSINVLAGYEVEHTTDRVSSMTGIDFPNSELYHIKNAGQVTAASSSENERGLISYLSRVNYVFDDKYYLSASYRSDGSSILSENNRFGNFWSVSGSWHLSKENFLSSATWLTDWRIRGSYGTNGTLPNNWYASQGLYSFGNNYNGNIGGMYSSINNPNLRWEQNYAANIGTNIRILDFMSIEFDIFNKETKDLILSVPISHTTGFKNTLVNYGGMNNKGWELGISTDNITNKNFQWTTSVVMGQVKNTITKLYDDVIPWPNFQIYREGYSINSIFLREYVGVNPQNGNAQWYTNTQDEHGNIISRELTENYNEANAVIVGSTDPILEGNITNTFHLKGFDLSAMFNYRIGGYTYDRTAADPSRGGVNQSENDGAHWYVPIRESGADRWQKPGDITDVPRYVYGNTSLSGEASTRFMHKADFIRLKSLTFGYTLPQQLTRSINMDRVRIYFSGMNLWTWAANDIYDPEVKVNGLNDWTLPPMKTYTFGIQVDF
ncbi:SusC/RagA family TonB-linked outer membrane protein [Saccharicrinis aurantiacus]|uniref:SusC/RagA family TonB-linked outer membrane protein n=1 Tax=Saccharicrinis aurantiacus TaxID=1849719 RepID=UPI00094F8529|nr:TonB-dependent receptor [Saccharicrinis aurantiacus]